MTTELAGRLMTVEHATEFMLAGNATVTLRSVATQTRYTYRIRQAKKNPSIWFVSLLMGTDNENDYMYLGVIRNGKEFALTSKSKYPATSKPVVAFDWTFKKLIANVMPKDVEIWHEGRCGRCSRKLTVPESVQRGIGPECAGIMGMVA